MAAVIYLDTHVAAWLYMGESDRLSPKAVDLIDRHDLQISPMVLLELQFLHEVGKIGVVPEKILQVLMDDLGLKVCSKPFERIVRESFKRRWTRDPFDRIISAHAALNHNLLLTKDESIRRHYDQAVW